MIIYKMLNKYQPLRCSCCGRFMRETVQSSYSFIPDTAYSREEELYHCEDCTITYGPPVSMQSFYPHY